MKKQTMLTLLTVLAVMFYSINAAASIGGAASTMAMLEQAQQSTISGIRDPG